MLTEVDALRALSQQHGVPGIDLTQVAILTRHLDLIPREIAEAHLILPALVRDDRIFLAMATPSDKRVIDELEFVTGKKVYPYVALSYDAREDDQGGLRGEGIGPHVLPRPERSCRDAEAARAHPVGGQRHDDVGAGASSTRQRRARSAGCRRRQGDREGGVRGRARDGDNSGRSTARRSPPSRRSPTSFAAAPTPLPPRVGSHAPGGADVYKTMPGSRSKVILVVDDEEDIRKLLKRLLADKGHRVVEADRGLLALRMVKEHTPDLIILDAMLPELHGFDIARRIKGSEKYGQIPIIMVSAVYRGWRIAEDLKNNYGIEEYIEKPFRITDVLKAVQRLLTERDQKRRDEPSATRDPDAVSAEAEKALADGIAAYKAGRIDEAIEHLAKGVQIDPLAYRLRYHLALLYGKKGMVYEAISELERAVDLNPRHFPGAEEPRGPLREGRASSTKRSRCGSAAPRSRPTKRRASRSRSIFSSSCNHGPARADSPRTRTLAPPRGKPIAAAARREKGEGGRDRSGSRARTDPLSWRGGGVVGHRARRRGIRP